ncbi:DoxX family protein [Polaromonas sp. YR568]|uniref:DoxX family protein n=1 Tax=Polaromonas sp. YR568 TaxID=1855301 RepID=UPI00313840FC
MNDTHDLTTAVAPPAGTPIARALGLWAMLTRALDHLQPAAALLARLYVAQVFFMSGLTKLRDWGTTVALFTDEYHVPLLSPSVAAVLGTAGEIVLPVLLVLGLGGRFSALGLFVVNAVAVISLSEIAPAALQQHVFWGSLLAGLAIYGAGPWSLDRWATPAVARRFPH